MASKRNTLSLSSISAEMPSNRILTKQQIKDFQQKMGIVFRDFHLLEWAFVHRSYLNESKGTDQRHNERLEFLGDAVLEFIVTDRLFRLFPDKPEGVLTSYRAALVQTSRLTDIANNLGLYEFIAMSKGQKHENDRADRHILANTLEALIGAIYLDRGLGTVELFLDQWLFCHVDEVIHSSGDPKSTLQEITHERLSITPYYVVTDESGPDHDKKFIVHAMIGDRHAGEGSGASKKDAEQNAAKDALQKEFGICSSVQ